jgi:hypothetical protein
MTGGSAARLLAAEISRGHRWRTAQTRLPFRVVTCVSDRAALAEIQDPGSGGAAAAIPIIGNRTYILDQATKEPLHPLQLFWKLTK